MINKADTLRNLVKKINTSLDQNDLYQTRIRLGANFTDPTNFEEPYKVDIYSRIVSPDGLAKNVLDKEKEVSDLPNTEVDMLHYLVECFLSEHLHHKTCCTLIRDVTALADTPPPPPPAP